MLNRFFCILAVLLAACDAPAQLLSIDINGTVRPDVTEPGFTPWYMAADFTGTKQTVSRSFTNFVYTYDPGSGLPLTTNVSLVIPCTVTMTYPPIANATNYLNANYANKNGNATSSDPTVGWRLSEDGCWAHWKNDAITVDQPFTNGGAISLVIANLPAGVHTITTYHNDIWGSAAGGAWHGTNVMSRCIISVNGTPVFTNTPSLVATNDSKCGFAFFYVTNSYDGQIVQLNFDPDHSSVLDFTILNGFEIDRPSAPGTSASAVSPTPATNMWPPITTFPCPAPPMPVTCPCNGSPPVLRCPTTSISAPAAMRSSTPRRPRRNSSSPPWPCPAPPTA